MRNRNSNEKEPALRKLQEMHRGFVYARTLQAGIQLAVFTHIAEGHTTAPSVSDAAGASLRGIRMLLDALTGLGLLEKSGDEYLLTDASRRYLVKSSPDYMGGMMESDELWDTWKLLPQIVRSGQPALDVTRQKDAEPYFTGLVESLHIINTEAAKRSAGLINPDNAALSVLDIGCGTGVWSLPFASQNPATVVTANDYAGLLQTTREYAERFGVADRYRYLPGDLKTVDFGKDQFDVAILGNIIHSEGETSSRDLLRRLGAAVRKGGHVLIFEQLPNEERTAPAIPLVFALNMLVQTDDGDVFSLQQMSKWLTDTGFTPAETTDIGWQFPMVYSTRV